METIGPDTSSGGGALEQELAQLIANGGKGAEVAIEFCQTIFDPNRSPEAVEEISNRLSETFADLNQH